MQAFSLLSVHVNSVEIIMYVVYKYVLENGFIYNWNKCKFPESQSIILSEVHVFVQILHFSNNLCLHQ